MHDFVECRTQADMDRAVANGDVAVVRVGFFRASGSATVHASGSATVHASPFVAIQRTGELAKVNGGVLIQVPEVTTAEQFFDYYGLKVTRGTVILYKLVGGDYVSTHGASYRPGEKPVAEDWDPEPCCGGGLHFSPRPFMARKYASPSTERFVACRVKVADLVVIPGGDVADKVKARSCTVLYECTEDGVKLVSERVAA